ncbi:MAG TPA: hypothetical protein DD473_17915, partial [Planctomycetaceae bacterium]|nr:hypothetical protein [Planctomycetaceae bacterium]
AATAGLVKIYFRIIPLIGHHKHAAVWTDQNRKYQKCEKTRFHEFILDLLNQVSTAVYSSHSLISDKQISPCEQIWNHLWIPASSPFICLGISTSLPLCRY